MDTAFEKIGLYDLFGTFLAGTIIAHLLYVITVFCLSPEAWSAIAQSQKTEVSLNVFSVTVLSFALGLALENCASVQEKDRWKFRKNAMQNIVMGDEMVQQGIARKKYQNMVFSILGNQKKSLTVEEQGEYVYQYCKIYLEAKGINSKEININAIYVLSRNVMLGFYGCLLWCGLIFLVNFIFAWEGNASIPSFFSTCLNMGNASNCILVEVVIALLCLIKVFRRRCIQYSEYRVKVVLREYYYHTRRDQAQA